MEIELDKLLKNINHDFQVIDTNIKRKSILNTLSRKSILAIKRNV